MSEGHYLNVVVGEAKPMAMATTVPFDIGSSHMAWWSHMPTRDDLLRVLSGESIFEVRKRGTRNVTNLKSKLSTTTYIFSNKPFLYPVA